MTATAKTTTTVNDDGLDAWIRRVLADPDLVRMGHGQEAADGNLGLGWIYYGLARLVQPARAVVIGSWRGFVPLVIARACQDNRSPGEVTFIDPSLVDGFWRDPAATRAQFARFGIGNVRHHLATTQEFVRTEAYRALGEVGLLFVDGFHTAEQARFDYEAFAPLLGPRAVVLFHDSLNRRESRLYGADKAYRANVGDYLDELRRDPGLQLLDLPFGEGVTVLRRVTPADQVFDAR